MTCFDFAPLADSGVEGNVLDSAEDAGVQDEDCAVLIYRCWSQLYTYSNHT